MSSAALAVLPWLLLIFGPGYCLLRVLRVPGSPGILLAGAPPVSFGLLYLVGLAATRAAVSVQLSCLAVLAALALAWLVSESWHGLRPAAADGAPERGWRGRGGAAIRAIADPWREPTRAAGRLLGLAAVVLGVVLWRQVHSQLTVPAGWDAMHHAYFVRQISVHDTLSSSVVFSTEPNGPADGSGFYPLAMNLFAALIHVSTGLRISAVLLAGSVAIVGVGLPLAVYALTRRLLPSHPVTAGFAAIASVLPGLLYLIEYTGRITDVQGLAMLPAALTVVIAFGTRFDWRVLLVGPLVVIGVIGLHTSELPVFAGLVLAVAVTEMVRHGRWRSAALWLASMAGAGAIAWGLLIAAVPGISHLISQRSGAFGPAHGGDLPFTQALYYVSSLPQWGPVATRTPMHIWVICALVGCVLILAVPRWRPLTPLAIGYLGYAAFYTLWVFGHVGPLAVVADAWYRVYTRMQWEFCVLGAIPVGVTMIAAVALVRASVLRLRRPSTDPPLRLHRLAAGTLGIAGAAALVVPMLPPVHVDAHYLRGNASPVGRHESAAFRYLSAHVLPGERVLDDLDGHGDTWMFADYGVANLFGNPPLIGMAPNGWKDRLYLRARLRNIESDGCVNRLLATYDVAWVYYSTSRMDGAKLRISLRMLQSTPAFQLAYKSGDAYVFRIDRTGLPTVCKQNVSVDYPWSTLANAN